MKKLKELLTEAIDPDFAEKKLRHWSQKVSGASGPTLEYVKTLEAVLSYLAPTSGKTNVKFDKFIKDRQRRQKSAERMAAGGEDKKQDPVGKLPEPESVDPEAKTEKEPEAKDSFTSAAFPPDEVDPDVSGLVGKQPRPKSSPKVAPSADSEEMPSMKDLSRGGSKKKVSKKSATKAARKAAVAKAGPRKPEKIQGTELEKLSDMIGKAHGNRELGQAKLQPVAATSDEMSPKQNWKLGAKVDVFGKKGALITGGSWADGWTLKHNGKDFVFLAKGREGQGLHRDLRGV